MNIKSGKINRYFPDRGFGFIRPLHRGPDVFFHVSQGTAVRWDEFGLLDFGGPFDMTKLIGDQTVSYQASDAPRGPKATRFWLPEGLEIPSNWRAVWNHNGKLFAWWIDLGQLNKSMPRTETSIDQLFQQLKAGLIHFEYKAMSDHEAIDSREGWTVYNGDPRRLMNWQDCLPHRMRTALLRFAVDSTKTDAYLHVVLEEIGCHNALVNSHHVRAFAPDGEVIQI